MASDHLASLLSAATQSSPPPPPLPTPPSVLPFQWTWRSSLLPPARPAAPDVPPAAPVALVPKHLKEDEQFLAVYRAQQDRASGAALANLKEAAVEQEEYPHVYQATKMAGLKGLSYGGRFALPMGTVREDWPVHEEVTVPPSRPLPPKISERQVLCSELEPLCQGSFPGYVTLNRIQSIVYPTAYKTNENLLICAPTGAGKTDVAMLSILRVLSQHLLPPILNSRTPNVPRIAKDDFKIIYVAPMKALASEVTRKFGKRLAWLGIHVRELTGDMQLTKQEINDTQIIVTTPEKWDVVTRKPTGEGELASKVKLLIIDEVHLLNEERGAVIETIVARTLRQVESSQSLIRIVGLSATLPNYVDVGDFLRVSRYKGLFFFDSSFRPVPLEQHFCGIKGKTNSPVQKKNMDEVVFEKVSDNVREGHQVMVFVHARKETVKSGMKLHEQALEEGMAEEFSCQNNPAWERFHKDIGTSKNKEMKELFMQGIGIHHAGMLRSDRNLMERAFEANCLKVLCCTSTLAWGVNLPAHAVVIKGTQVYDSSVGKFVDLSILDVLQIFGRAGRPGYESSGVGYICTPQDKLDHYLEAILSQHPIESQFVGGMIDSMNAEIALGTIANVSEAVQWMGYTYLFVRMRRNPFYYGMPHDVTADDPQLGNKRHQLVTLAAKKLTDAKMVVFDEGSGKFTITDLGRIAAKYYIRMESIVIFNEHFRPKMTEADVLAMLAMSTEFDQIQVRENEVPELKFMMDEIIPCQVKGGTDTSQGKVNILLQGYVSRFFVEDFALVSDSMYAAQNGGRIIRALFEIAMSRRAATTALVLLSLSKAIEKRLWPYDHPLRQFELKQEVLYNLSRFADDLPIADLANSNADDLGVLVHMNKVHGQAILTAARQFPTVTIHHELRPLSHDLLEVSLSLERTFEWNDRLHGSSEPFWVWAEDHTGSQILQFANVLLRPTTSAFKLDFVVPIKGARPPFISIRVCSDHWIGAEDTLTIDLDHLVMPDASTAHTPLLDLPFLSLSNVQDAQLKAAYPEISSFNAIQTAVFWSMYHAQTSLLLSASSGSGKSTLGEMAIWRALREDSSARVLILVPRRDWARDLASRLRSRFGRSKAANVSLLLRPSDFQAPSGASHPIISVSYPGAVASALAGSSKTFDGWAQSFNLLILDDLHLLDAQFEVVASRLLSVAKASLTRVIGLAASLNDPQDVGTWLGVDPSAVFSFLPKDRGTALATAIQTFTMPHSAILNKAMIKPAFDILRASTQPAILFASSRAHCVSSAADLVTQSGTHMDINGFLSTNPENLEPMLHRLRDRSLTNGLLRGIGIFHDGLAPTDIALVLELFATGVIRVLVVAREACWSLPVRAPIVVVLGTQYLQLGSHVGPPTADSKRQQRERQVSNYPLQEVLQMQSFAVLPPTLAASSANGSPRPTTGSFTLFCQAEHREFYLRFLSTGLPLESTLHSSALLRSVLQSEKERGTVKTKQDALDLTSHTLLARRMRTNPTFYGVELEEVVEDATADGEAVLVRAVEGRLSRLVDAGLDEQVEEVKEKEDSRVLEVSKENEVRHVPGSAPKV